MWLIWILALFTLIKVICMFLGFVLDDDKPEEPIKHIDTYDDWQE